MKSLEKMLVRSGARAFCQDWRGRAISDVEVDAIFAPVCEAPGSLTRSDVARMTGLTRRDVSHGMVR